MDNLNKEDIEKQKSLELLKNSYEMYERSKAETIKVRKEKTDNDGNRIYSDDSLDTTIELMNTMQADIKEKYLELGGKEEDLKKKDRKKGSDKKLLLQAIEKENQKDEMLDYISKMNKESNKKSEIKNDSTVKEDYTKKMFSKLTENDNNTNKITEDTMPFETALNTTTNDDMIKNQDRIIINNDNIGGYDTIKLPSKGECYKNKMKDIEVSYLTAYDENLILSPNLYKNGTFLDHILKNKIKSDISPDNLIQGDRDAIIIWLRATGYGNEYPITIIDDKTGKEFNTSIDLSKLKYKKFNLKGDENGYFDFTLPKTKDVIKFKFLTNGDAKKLEKLKAEEDKEIKINKFKDCTKELKDIITNTDLISDDTYESIKNSLNNIETIVNTEFNAVPETYYTHDLTNRLILSTVSINGNSNKEFIINYILNMNLKDAAAYRKYIIENEPGIDYNIKVQRPDSLGGGYIETFLRLDQFIFINQI